MTPLSRTTYRYWPSVTGVGTSGPLSNAKTRCDVVTSPRPPARNARSGRSRLGAQIISPATNGDATIRYEGLLVGFRPLARHSSLPVAGSWPVTTSPPVTTISWAEPLVRRAGVVQADRNGRRLHSS